MTKQSNSTDGAIDMNVTQLATEIERSRNEDDGTDSGVGLSASRTIENGVATWDVFIGISHSMTVLDSENNYRNTPTADIAARIIQWWDTEWDD